MSLVPNATHRGYHLDDPPAKIGEAQGGWEKNQKRQWWRKGDNWKKGKKAQGWKKNKDKKATGSTQRPWE